MESRACFSDLAGTDIPPLTKVYNHFFIMRASCCRIAAHHPACLWVYWIEEINSITTQICRFHFGNGMAGLIPGSEIIAQRPQSFLLLPPQFVRTS